MAKTDEGEFELVLGNRQLISVFLIVVILLGVFFSMGYIVGRNSATASEEASTDTKAVESPPARTTTPSSSPVAAAPPAQPSAADLKPSPTGPPQSTHAEQPAAPAPAKPAPAKPTPAAETKPAPAASRPALSSGAPASGDYWQVVATSHPDAEIISEALGRKGFHAIIAPGPRPDIFRVLVGPLKDSSSQAQTRTSLEAAGFKNPILRKY